MAPPPYVFYLPSRHLLLGFVDLQHPQLDLDLVLSAVNS